MQPDFKIVADSEDITDKIRQRLISIRLVDEAGIKSDTVSIQLDDRDSSIIWPDIGKTLSVFLGYKSCTLTLMGKFLVDELSHRYPPSTFTINAKAADMRRDLKTQRTQSWSTVAIGDIVSTIAARYNLKPRVSEAYSTISIPHIDQTEESDLHFLTRLAKRYDAVAKPANDYLLFVVKGEAKTAAGLNLPTLEIPEKQIISYQYNQTERNKYQSVIAFWADKEAGERVSVKAGGDRPSFAIRDSFQDAAQALDAAGAKLASLNRGAATLSFTAIGDTDFQAERKVLPRVKRNVVNATWVITRVEHQISSAGFISRIESETPN